MRRALIITEDTRGLGFLQSALVRESYKVAMCAPGEDEILEAMESITPEVAIVDCRADAERAVAARRLLGVECNLKELLIVALMTPAQAVDANWSGVDDFVLEPFNGEELLSRLRLLFWRTKGVNNDETLKIKELLIDMGNYDVSIDGTPIELTFKEYELLKFLATHRGRVFTREALLDHVWGYDYYGGTRTVDVHIRRLRAKLSPGCDAFIETVRNVGYRFAS